MMSQGGGIWNMGIFTYCWCCNHTDSIWQRLLKLEVFIPFATATLKNTHSPYFLLLFLKIYFIDYAITVVPIFPPLPPSSWCPHPLQQSTPTLAYVCASCIVSSLASPFPILFSTSPCLFLPTIYASDSLHLFPHFSPSPSQLITVQVISISVILLLFYLFAWFVFLDSVVDSCEFVAILLFIFFIFFFLDKSL